MPTWTKKETQEDGWNFFQEAALNDAWFPEVEDIELTLTQNEAKQLLDKMDAVSKAHASICVGRFPGTYSIMMPPCDNMRLIFHDDEAGGSEDGVIGVENRFRPECREVEFNIFDPMNKPTVRWSMMHKYTDDKIVSDWMTYEQIKNISEGRDPYGAPAPRYQAQQESLTILEVEAALCVWEWVNEATIHWQNKQQPWVDLRDGVGSVSLRHASMQIGQWCLAVYDICTAQDRDFFEGYSYDWEVIPLIMSLLPIASVPIYGTETFPDPATIAPLVAAEVERWRSQ
jgi:hypothetical protein